MTPAGGPGFTDLGFARPDTDREARQGVPEVVFAPGKSAGQIAGVVRSLLAANSGPVLVTRAEPAVADQVLAQVTDRSDGHPSDRTGGHSIDRTGGTYDAEARLLVWRPAAPSEFALAVVSAGTADGPVAAEAAAVAGALGLTVDRLADVGVAGLHRLLAERPRLEAADVIICIAGMEGALPSVVGGLVGCPVIAVPTSVGYGASLAGVTPLLAMLSSCAAGVTVVNIDSGFGAAMAAFRIATRVRAAVDARVAAQGTGHR